MFFRLRGPPNGVHWESEQTRGFFTTSFKSEDRGNVTYKLP